jgi:hypothetical protein
LKNLFRIAGAMEARGILADIPLRGIRILAHLGCFQTILKFVTSETKSLWPGSFFAG